jgi:hypothetical protein
LPSAAELSGVVVGEGDGAIARADVELFVRVNGRTLSLGRTTSDSAGRFSLVVPSP